MTTQSLAPPVMSPDDRARQRRARIELAAILLLTVIAYIPALRAGLVWDDDFHIHKPELHSFQGLIRIWTDHTATQQYYPIAHTAFWTQYMLWGERPLGFHAVNLAFHLLNTALVWTILRRLSVPGAVFAAGLFALHPVQ